MIEDIELIIDEENASLAIDAVSLVEFPAIESDWIALKKDSNITLAKVDEDKRLLIGAALIPDKKIYRFNPETQKEYNVYFSKETIKRASELYLMHNNQDSATLEHDTKISGITAVESWIVADKDRDKSAVYGIDVPVGTWMLSLKVDNDEIWQKVKDKSVKGYSIEGFFTQKMQSLSKQDYTDSDILNALAEILKIQ
tara:strand:+ start:7138 stop:7731 length:594 start_codon:yes stop_codon:yes gene_type:complete